MASEQLQKNPIHTHTVAAKDITYTAGDWKKPTGLIDPAVLISSNPLIETTAPVTLLSPATRKRLVISFALERNANQSGWERANLSIWAKVGNSERQTKSINADLLKVSPGISSVFSQTFEFNDAGKNLTFGLFDGTINVTKRGLDLYYGHVAEMA